ncbi:BLUF domain-containing protein [Comamonas kerstersii]|uniref:BLUF domain-containing protein n=1 Tax=Comamonas kerstersii TaxID=225992 RepID=UPI0014788A23|nr:BLUF domain-containing protein [Comamonas kerstersii]
MSQNLLCFLYHSQIAPDAPVSCVADIVKTARSFNQQHDITGMLIFDGMCFAQYIEGPEQAMEGLIARITEDPRHCQVVPMLHAQLQGVRRFARWSMAYAFVDEQEPIDELAALPAQAALQHFVQMQSMLDIA